MFTPSKKLLKKYADVLIKFALWSGKGVRPGESVCLMVPESAKSMLEPLMVSVLESKAHPVIDYSPEGIVRSFYKNANNQQLKYYPKSYMLGQIKDCTHYVRIISTDDKFELKGIDSKKIMTRQKSAKFFSDARDEKENAGKLSWTLGLYGTSAMAREANLSLKSYWNQIRKACFLNMKNPISKWKQVYKQIDNIQNKLNELKIESLNVKGKDVDLNIKLGKKRKWLGGSGRNIPSFEIFTCPDWRGTEGWAKFSEPLYRYGNLIEGIELHFKKGKVIKVKARKNEKLLKDMIKVENADKLGEFSLTDKRMSKITEFMAETLYDENVGGKYGNFHVALGKSFKDAYDGDLKKVKKNSWKKLGFNDSVIHTDIMSTTDRTVTAKVKGGKEKVIYKDGMFVL